MNTSLQRPSQDKARQWKKKKRSRKKELHRDESRLLTVKFKKSLGRWAVIHERRHRDGKVGGKTKISNHDLVVYSDTKRRKKQKERKEKKRRIMEKQERQEREELK